MCGKDFGQEFGEKKVRGICEWKLRESYEGNLNEILGRKFEGNLLKNKGQVVNLEEDLLLYCVRCLINV